MTHSQVEKENQYRSTNYYLQGFYCRYCNRSETWRSSCKSFDHATNEARKQGWRIGKTIICPDCLKKEKRIRESKNKRYS